MKGNLLRTWALWSRGLILALLSVSLVALFTEYAYAQVVRFAKTYGGTSLDWAYSVQQISDGGYIVAGYTTFGAGGLDIFLVKTNASGNVQWAKTYGGTNWEEARSVQQTSDGGYIVAGWTLSFGAGSYDFFLIKTNAFGNVQWAKTYGGMYDDRAHSVQQTSDGGYIVAGWTGSFGASADIFLIKTDANGNVQWAKTYGGANEDRALSVRQTSDGGYIVAGLTNSFGAGNGDIFLIKTDANGNIGSCGIVGNPSLTVTTPSLTVTTPSPSVYSISLTPGSPSLTITSPTLTVSEVCVLSFDDNVGISESCQIASGLIIYYHEREPFTHLGAMEQGANISPLKCVPRRPIHTVRLRCDIRKNLRGNKF